MLWNEQGYANALSPRLLSHYKHTLFEPLITNQIFSINQYAASKSQNIFYKV